MLAGVLLLASSPDAAAIAQLRDVFVDVCVNGQAPSATLNQIEGTALAPALLRDTAGATSVRVFSLSGREQAYLAIAEFSGRPDGVTSQCGVSAPQWSTSDAVKAVFGKLGSPKKTLPPINFYPSGKYFWKHVGGNQDSKGYKTQIVYGRLDRSTFVVLRQYNDFGATSRFGAAELLKRCFGDEPAGCTDDGIKDARSILLGSYVSP